MTTTERINTACEKAYKALREYNLYPEVYPYGNNMPVIEVSISWGDWKHDHLCAKLVLEEIGFTRIKQEVTEEDGSDCYSAIHYFIIPSDMQ